MSDVLGRAIDYASVDYAPDISYDDWKSIVVELVEEVKGLQVELKNQKDYVALMHDRNNLGAQYGNRMYLENKKLKKQIEELSRNHNFLRLTDEINWDYEIWGGCYTDEEYDERAVVSLSRKDDLVDWRRVVEEYNESKRKTP